LQAKLAQAEKISEDLKNKLKNVVREKDSVTKDLSSEKSSKLCKKCGGPAGDSRPSSASFVGLSIGVSDVVQNQLDGKSIVKDLEAGLEGQEAILKYLHKMCSRVQDTLKAELKTAESNKVTSARSSGGCKTTVGLMLDNLTIDSMVVGSPAHSSKQLLPGDVITKIDGKSVSLADLDVALQGCDVPGSELVLTIQRDGVKGERDVVLVRMERDRLADNVRMFELFTILKDVAVKQATQDQMPVLEECMQLWQKMLEGKSDNEKKIESGVHQLKNDCAHDMTEITKGLDDLGLLSKEALSSVTSAITDLNQRLHDAQQQIAAKQKWMDEMHPGTKDANGNQDQSGLDKLLALSKKAGHQSLEHDFDSDLLELIKALEGTCANLETGINQDVLSVPTATSSSGFAAKATVGVMLNDLVIHNMVVGGPAYKCKQLEVGDEIIKVDGVEVSADRFEEFQKALIGDDVPGSTLTLTVRKQPEEESSVSEKEVTVKLRRMAREEMADHVKMFELFTSLKEYVLEGDFSKACGGDGSSIVAQSEDGQLSPQDCVDECMDLWTRMLVADAEHDDKIANNVRELQDESAILLSTLREGIARLRAFVNQKRDHLNRCVTRIVWRLKNRNKIVAFESWHENVVSNRRIKRNLSHTLAKWKNKSLATAMTTWMGKAAESRRLRNKAVQVVGRWLNKASAMVFTAWQDFVKAEKRQQYVLKKVIGNWKNQQKAAVFHRWLEQCNEASRLRNVAAKVVARWTHGALVAMWNRWTEMSSEQKKMKHITGKVLARFRSKCVVAALVAWVEHVEEYKRLRNVTQKVLLRWMRQTLAMGFTTWHEHVMDIRRAKVVKSKVAARWRLKSVSSALARWMESAVEMVRLRRILDKVLRRWTHQALSGAFTNWFAHSKEQRRQADTLSKVLYRMMHAVVSSAFDRWSSQTELFTRQRATLERILLRMQNGKLAAAFDRWGTQVETFTKQRAVLERILLRMQNGKIAAAFDRWGTQVETFTKQRAVLERILLRMYNKDVAAALDRWKDNAKELREMRFKGSKVLLRWLKMGM